MTTVNVSRRRFLRSTAMAGGGLVIGFSMTGCARAPLPIEPDANGWVPNAFLQMTADGRVRFYCPRDEMGQGVSTGLATIIAEELDLDPARFDIAFAGVHEDYDNPAMGMQVTGGSTSINAHYLPLRQVGANTRALLLEAAALDLDVPAADLTTEDGHVIHAGARHPYTRFIATAARLEAPASAPLKDAADFRWIGADFPRLDAAAKATGTAEFGIDVEVPGMHYAAVRRAPVAGARRKSVDATVARSMPGVTDVVEIGSGVAVVAERYWQARKAADALEPVWDHAPLARVDTATIRHDYEQALAGGAVTDGVDVGRVSGPTHGDLEAGLAAADTVLEAEYWAPHLAHAPLEPMNAVLHIHDGEADLWTGTQSASGAQGLVARASGIDADRIRVHNTYLGGAFGRRGTLTHVTEVTEIAVATGKPIKLLWSREDDMRHGLYRPASLMKIRAGVAGDRITAWDAQRVGGNITPETIENALPGLFPSIGDRGVRWISGAADYVMANWFADGSSIEGLFEDYDFDHLAVNHVTVDHGLPLTFWRSVGHSYSAFAKESMVDEIAVALKADPVELRLANTRNNPRLQNVIRVAGERMAAMRPAPGRHLGFAAHHSFATDVAEIAEVSVEGGRIRVHRVTCVVDCGVAINPDIVRAQLEGGVIFGLTAALYGNLELDAGAIRESNFHDYPLLRMDESPEVDVFIVDSGTEPTGVGEPGLPPIAPAVANAVFRATGQRLRSLPLTLAV
jgi:isoquinoline 1-oxidoreductase/isoquinoline 1-oxidoreductase beta subunit